MRTAGNPMKRSPVAKVNEPGSVWLVLFTIPPFTFGLAIFLQIEIYHKSQCKSVVENNEPNGCLFCILNLYFSCRFRDILEQTSDKQGSYNSIYTLLSFYYIHITFVIPFKYMKFYIIIMVCYCNGITQQ